MRNIKIIALAVVFAVSGLFAQDIDLENLKRHINYLAADSLKGRKAGEQSAMKAAEYIKRQFENHGLEPLCDDYFQYFDVVKEVNPGLNNSFAFDDFKGRLKKDFTPLSFTKNCELTAPVVFVGYGFDIDLDTLKWNDYDGIDVKGKWVMVLRGDPEIDDAESVFIPYSKERSKVVTAEDYGAAGVIFVTGPKVNSDDELLSLYYDKTQSRADIPFLNVTREVANKLLKKNLRSVGELEKKINKTREPIRFEIPIEVKAATEVELEKSETANVVGLLKSSDAELSDEYILIGAHYDHLGMGGPGSGSRTPDTIAVHYGADDNASGAAGVVELAREFAENRAELGRSIIFAAFSAEEMGLLGSKAFVRNSPVDLKKIVAMVNFDMIGRLKENETVMISGTGTSVETDSLLDLIVEDEDLKLSKSQEGFGPSDHASFYAENIPVFFISTGVHADYHTPRDNVDKIKYAGEKRVLELSYELVFTIANRSERLTYQEAGPKHRVMRGRFKVRLGFMPDFSQTDKPGVGVGGVNKDGPGYEAGLKKGDRITAIDGKKIKDIYEYMHMLNKLEPGQIITIDVMREGEKKVLIVHL